MDYFPLIQRMSGQSNAATAAALDTEQVQPGELWEVQAYSIYNTSGESVTATIAIVTGSEVIQVLPKLTIADGDAAGNQLWHILGENQRLRASITGTANHGAVAFLVTGRRFSWVEEMPDQVARSSMQATT